MFDFIRKHNKAFMIILFLIGVPGFLFIGVEGYFKGDQKGERVARVGEHDITRPEWEAQHRSDVDRIRRQRPNLDPALFDSDAARYATLERMVQGQLLAVAAQEAGLVVTEQRQAELLQTDPGLSQFVVVDKDGRKKFDTELFGRMTGQTPQQYQNQLVAELTTQQVLADVVNSAFATRTQATTAFDALYDRREVQVAHFDPAQFASQVTLSDADLQAFYKEHTGQFQAPEQAQIEYIVLDLDAAKKKVVVNEADLKGYYEQNSARFGKKEERRASHILISAPSSASAEERSKAKARVEGLMAELKKAPGSFAELARKNSQDPGSAEKGGELDFVTRSGAMVKPFEDALFTLKKGEISNVVETEYGYHIIRLDDIRPAEIPPFEVVRPAIENELRAQQATQEFAKAAELMTDIVYQQADSLKPAAEKLGLTIQTANGIGRTPAPNAAGPLASKNFLSALFSADVQERKHNTEAIEVGPNQLAAGRVTQYAAARTLPFEEVKQQVQAQLVAQRSAVLARKEGEAKLSAWQNNPQSATVGQPMLLSRTERSIQAPQMIEAALRTDASKLPAWIGVDLGPQGYAIAHVNKAVPRETPSADIAKREIEQFSQTIASAEQQAFYKMLKERFKVQILVPRPTEASVVANR